MTQALLLAGVPVLVAAPARIAPSRVNEPHVRQSVRTVLWCHGFRADSAAHEAELARLAESGWLAVGIDAVGHGRRANGDLSDRIADEGAKPVMLELADATVRELPELLIALDREYGADPARISIVGISMGAFLAYRAVERMAALGVPLKACVALLGSPEWPGDDSPHHAVEVMRRTALLSIIAEYDERVSPEPARRLHAALTTWYGPAATHRYMELRGSGHLTNAAHWHHAMNETFEWLERWG